MLGAYAEFSDGVSPTDLPDNHHDKQLKLVDELLRIPLSGISPTALGTGSVILDLLQSNLSPSFYETQRLECSSFTTEEQQEIVDIIKRTSIPEFELLHEKQASKKKLKYPKTIFEKIEKACMDNIMETSVVTSAKKIPPSPWIAAPGTPVSEAWETHSGPMAAPSPMATPLRKIILKLPNITPKPVPKTQKIESMIKSETVIKLKTSNTPNSSSGNLGLDIEHKLVKLSDNIACDVEDSALVGQIQDLFSDFSVESVAAFEWLNENASKLLADSHRSIVFKRHIAGMLILQLSSLLNYNAHTPLILLAVGYLVADPYLCTLSQQIWQSIVRLFDRIPIEESQLVSIGTNLLKISLNEFNQPCSQLFAVMALKCQELKVTLIPEMLSNSPNENLFVESWIICSVVQCEILKSGINDGNSGKETFGSLIESVYKIVSSAPSQGASLVCRMLKGLPLVLNTPELPVSECYSKILVNFALVITCSGEKVKLDTLAKQQIIDALATVGSFLRPLEKAECCHSFNIEEHLKDTFVPSASRAALIASYNALLANDSEPKDLKNENHYKRIVQRCLNDLSSTIITGLVRISSDLSVQVRIKSLRALVSVLEKDDVFFTKSGFIDFILGKLGDSSATIRDVTLELIGKGLDPEKILSVDILTRISPCLHDSSSAVQRRTIRMYRDLILSTNDLELRSFLIAGLMKVHRYEDPSIANLAFKTLKDTWLVPLLENTGCQQDITNFVALIIRIIRFLSSESDCVQTFFAKSREDASILSKLFDLCTPSVDILFESLITSIESSKWDAVRFILNAILIFVGSEHSYLSPHMRLLYELSKSEEMNSVEYSLKLLKIAVVNADRAVLMQLHDIFPHLSKLIIKGSEPVVKEAVGLLLQISKQNDDANSPLLPLWNRFSKFLVSKMNCTEYDSNIIRPICRALYSLGCLASTSEFGTELCKQSIEIIIAYSKKTDEMAQFYSIQALTNIISHSPNLALQPEVSAVMHEAFSWNRASVNVVLLKLFLNMIESPDRAHLIDFSNSMKSSNLSLSATIIQSYVKEIADASSTSNQECQLISVQLLSSILNGGHCHPQQVMPALVALSSSHASRTRTMALDVLKAASETHSTFLLCNYSQALRSVFNLQCKYKDVFGYVESGDKLQSWLSPIYEEVRTKKSKRDDFVSMLVREFIDTDEIEFSRFIIENLATLPIRHLEEACRVFTFINDLALNLSSIVIETEYSTQIEHFKAFMALSLRNHLSMALDLNLEKCEKAAINENIGKATVSEATQYSSPDFAQFLGLNDEDKVCIIQKMLDEQRHIESGCSEKVRAPTSAASKKKRKSRKRARPYECSEPEITDSDSNHS